MKEFRFKILSEGEKLVNFSHSEIVIKKFDGSYKIYRIEGFNEGTPIFYKNPNIVQIFDLNEICNSILCQKTMSEYRIYKIKSFDNGLVEIDGNFVLIVEPGFDKLKVHDTESNLTITLQAKDAI